jgi:hypothetical protein
MLEEFIRDNIQNADKEKVIKALASIGTLKTFYDLYKEKSAV